MKREDYYKDNFTVIKSFLEKKLQEKRTYLENLNLENTQDFSQIQINKALKINARTSIERLQESLQLLEKGKYGFCKECSSKISYSEIILYPYKTKCGSCIQKK